MHRLPLTLHSKLNINRKPGHSDNNAHRSSSRMRILRGTFGAWLDGDLDNMRGVCCSRVLLCSAARREVIQQKHLPVRARVAHRRPTRYHNANPQTEGQEATPTVNVGTLPHTTQTRAKPTTRPLHISAQLLLYVCWHSLRKDPVLVHYVLVWSMTQ